MAARAALKSTCARSLAPRSASTAGRRLSRSEAVPALVDPDRGPGEGMVFRRPPACNLPGGIEGGEPRLRRYPPPELPAVPYPLLLPYSHPDLMAGRDADLAGLRRTLTRPVTAVGLHAASGTGKSSLLTGALVPALRAEGRPVALVRHPAEAGCRNAFSATWSRATWSRATWSRATWSRARATGSRPVTEARPAASRPAPSSIVWRPSTDWLAESRRCW